MDGPGSAEDTTATPPARRTLADTEVISHLGVLRFVRSVLHPLFRPHRYFEDSLERPDDYLKPGQAIALGFFSYWAFDQTLSEALAKQGVDLTALTVAQHQVVTIFRALLPLLTVWGHPFFVRFIAAALRLDMGWSEATQFAAFSVPLRILGTVLQLSVGGLPVSAGMLLLSSVAYTFAFTRLGRRSVLRSAVATVLLVALELLVFSSVLVVYGVWLTSVARPR